MNQTVPVTVKKCERCNGRIVKGDEPYCFQCGHRPEGFASSAHDAGPLVQWVSRAKREAAAGDKVCVNGHLLVNGNIVKIGGEPRCRKCNSEAERLAGLRFRKVGVA